MDGMKEKIALATTHIISRAVYPASETKNRIVTIKTKTRPINRN